MNAKLSKIIREAVAENNALNKVLKTETAADSIYPGRSADFPSGHV